jgi:hypothetical protein
VGGDTVELFDGEIALAEYCVQLQAGVHEDEWALEEDTVKDWDGEVHIREDCVLLTKGVHKGEWIAEDSDELIVLEYGDYCHTEDAAWVEGNRWCGGRHEEMSRRKTKVPFGKALAFDLAFRAAKEVAHAHC